MIYRSWQTQTSSRWMNSCKGGSMPSYTKIIDGLTDLGIYKMQEYIDHYINAVNNGEKSFSDALEELISIEQENNRFVCKSCKLPIYKNNG